MKCHLNLPNLKCRESIPSLKMLFFQFSNSTFIRKTQCREISISDHLKKHSFFVQLHQTSHIITIGSNKIIEKLYRNHFLAPRNGKIGLFAFRVFFLEFNNNHYYQHIRKIGIAYEIL
jgi:hypothetical protein